MRVIALLCLFFGFMAQFILDGQPFTHAVMGVFCGITALATGLTSAREDPKNRWEGRIMALLGVALAIWCAVLLPSAHRFQKKFNDRKEQKQSYQ